VCWSNARCTRLSLRTLLNSHFEGSGKSVKGKGNSVYPAAHPSVQGNVFLFGRNRLQGTKLSHNDFPILVGNSSLHRSRMRGVGYRLGRETEHPTAV